MTDWGVSTCLQFRILIVVSFCGFSFLNHLAAGVSLATDMHRTDIFIKWHFVLLPQLCWVYVNIPDWLKKSAFSEATVSCSVSPQIHSYGGPVKDTSCRNTAL